MSRHAVINQLRSYGKWFGLTVTNKYDSTTDDKVMWGGDRWMGHSEWANECACVCALYKYSSRGELNKERLTQYSMCDKSQPRSQFILIISH